MNGQRIVQTEQEGSWINKKVDKAITLKPGIYNLYTALSVDKTKVSEGIIVHVDQEAIYQQTGKSFILHSRKDFDLLPDIGSSNAITYNDSGKAVVKAEPLKLNRSRSR